MNLESLIRLLVGGAARLGGGGLPARPQMLESTDGKVSEYNAVAPGVQNRIKP